MWKRNVSYTGMLSCLKPEVFEDVIEAPKIKIKFYIQNRTYKAVTRALQLCTYLKQIADLTAKIFLVRKWISIEDIDFSITNV